MRERDEDSEKITVEPPTVEGQATENPADEAKILADQGALNGQERKRRSPIPKVIHLPAHLPS